jgi:hypothetical protein
MSDMASFFKRTDVQTALHLTKGPQPSEFGYDSSGPASITLWPELVQKMRVLIYNGDSDACVPYKGNEEWTTSLETKGIVTEKKPWHPWFTDEVQNMPVSSLQLCEPACSSTHSLFARPDQRCDC